MKPNHKSVIKIHVELDENQIPEKLYWDAQDGGIVHQQTKAVFLSVWDHTNKEALRVDLWTKDMSIDHMKLFFYQMLMSMSDTLQKATNEEKMAKALKDFCEYYAESLNPDKKAEND